MWPFFYFGITLLSSASLILEVSLTRILSVTQGYHFAFMIVSTSLLGIGAGGTYLMFHIHRFRKPINQLLIVSPFLFCITTSGSYVLLNHIPFDLVKLEWEISQLGYLVLAYGILAVPFFFSGLTIATALSMAAGRVGQIYFFDLLGASIGALLPLLLYPMIGPPGTILVAGALSVISGLSLWWSVEPSRIKPLITLLLGICIVILSAPFFIPSWYEVRLSPYKGLSVALRYPDSEHLSTRWNVLSRIDVIRSPIVRFAPGLSLTYSGELPEQIGLTLNGDELYAITNDSDHNKLAFLKYLPSAVPYELFEPDRVLILDPGGGLDVLMSLYFNSTLIEVVERNPAIYNVVRNPAAGFKTNVYDDLRVKVHLSEPRSFLSSNNKKYDLIVLSLRDTLGSSSLGFRGFTENYSLTREAVGQYYQKLNEEGWLSITRYLHPVPIHEAKLAAILIESLNDLGIKNPERRIAAIRSWGTITYILKQGDITPSEIKKLKQFSEHLRFDLDYFPGIQPEEANRFNRFPEATYYHLIQQLLDPDLRADLYQDYPFDIRPISDDRPYFSYILKLSRLKEAYHIVHGKWLFLINGGLLLPVILIQAIVFSLILILIPTNLGTRQKPITKDSQKKWPILLYFILIGLAFMGVEIALIQRLILFLGHPVYSVSIVLAGMLFFAGTGSLATRRWLIYKKWRLRPLLYVISLMIIVEGIGLPIVIPSLMGLPIGARLFVSVLFIGPPAFLMGMAFPLGITYLKISNQEDLIPWAWAANGSVSVVSAILAVMVAMEVGFTAVFLCAAVAYTASGWMWDRLLYQKVE